MSAVDGHLCLVLHGHLPYVLHHGVFPHGEAWLYEAATETYLPLLALLEELAAHRIHPGLTIGLTPVLLEQLASDHFKRGLVAYLEERIHRASADRAEFEKASDVAGAALARRWQNWHARTLQQFEKLDRDLVSAFARHWRDDHVQLLTSNATHAYLPLMVTDQCISAQLAAGTSASLRHLGQSSRGIWLPECGYRPADEHWTPKVLWHDARYRPGIESFLTPAGIDHFFVDTHLVERGQPLGTLDRGLFHPVSEAQVYWDKQRSWRSVLAPAAVASRPEPPVASGVEPPVASSVEPPRCSVLARHPRVSEQVWSGIIGYPGAGAYLEFHLRHGARGLRYHRVTDVKFDLGLKQRYVPEDASVQAIEHAQHFCNIVRHALAEHRRDTGRAGVVVAPFDAELFGHWWHEGIDFLRNVIQLLSRDANVSLATAEQALAKHPPDTVLRLPEGSWGKNGDHGVWLNDRTRWMWEVEYRAEAKMLTLLRELPWQTNAAVREMMQRAGRQLLLLQASDWTFVVDSGAAADYGIARFCGHYTNFERMTTIAESLAAGHALTPTQQTEIANADAHDMIFAEIDLQWWNGK